MFVFLVGCSVLHLLVFFLTDLCVLFTTTVTSGLMVSPNHHLHGEIKPMHERLRSHHPPAHLGLFAFLWSVWMRGRSLLWY